MMPMMPCWTVDRVPDAAYTVLHLLFLTVVTSIYRRRFLVE